VNYRGSTGYGKDFLNAGRKEWGGKMQDDVTDAARWAVTQGWADPERVAIMGASYGGYAALAGATFTPDVFACAVSAMGPSNLITFLETVPPYWKPYMARMKLLIGDPAIETEFLRSRSPLFHVERIKIPILLMYGANDARVKISEGEQIVAAMAAKEIDYEFIVFPDEGHGFQQPHNRIKYYAAAEGFLAKYLGGRYEPYEEQ
jgi:dipeptidyl aminopeptidase/acylaminoacyl peptidase